MNSAQRKRKYWESMAKLKREHDENMRGLQEVSDSLDNMKEPTDGDFQELLDYGSDLVAITKKFKEVKENFNV